MKPKLRITLTQSLVIVILSGFVVAVGAAALVWADDERDRLMNDWQGRLTVLAASRASSVAEWVERQKHTVSALNENDALKIYVSEIGAAAGARASADVTAVERQYVETLLRVTARQSGFDEAPRGADIRASTARTPIAGVGLVDKDLRLIAATEAVPEPSAAVRELVSLQFQEPGVRVSSLYPDASGQRLFFAVTGPIYEIQTNTPIAALVAIKSVGEELFPLLKQPGEIYRTAEAMLVERDGNVVRYLSPLADGTPAYERVLSFDTPDLAAAFALGSPRDFAVRTDYQGVGVLVSGWPIEGTPWTLVYKVNRDEALGPAESRLRRALLLVALGLILAVAGGLALWRHGASVRANVAMNRYREAAAQLEKQVEFAQTLSDAEPNATFVIDAANRVSFANGSAAEMVGAATRSDCVGKTLDAVFGPHLAAEFRRHAEDARVANSKLVTLDQRDGDGSTHTIRSSFVPLTESATSGSAGVLVVQEDLTETLSAEQRLRSVQEQVLENLVSLIDSRDPSTASHSRRVAGVARDVAVIMNLDDSWERAAEQAALLLNVGRIFVPAELLTRREILKPDELLEVRAAITHGVEFIADIQFERPVGEIVRTALAKRERREDGAGDGADPTVDLCGRIVAAVDALVALTSPRAYRGAMDADAALSELDGDIVTFGSDVMAGVRHYVENQGGRSRLSN